MQLCVSGLHLLTLYAPPPVTSITAGGTVRLCTGYVGRTCHSYGASAGSTLIFGYTIMMVWIIAERFEECKTGTERSVNRLGRLGFCNVEESMLLMFLFVTAVA